MSDFLPNDCPRCGSDDIYEVVHAQTLSTSVDIVCEACGHRVHANRLCAEATPTEVEEAVRAEWNKGAPE